MNAHTDDEMDRIFTLFQEDRRSPAPRPLTAWISEHPDMNNCFVQWAAESTALEVAEILPADPQCEARSLAIGQSILERIGLGLRDDEMLSSINDAARSRGMSPRQLAQRIGVGMAVFAKLNRRLIRAASVPSQLIDKLSEELQVTTDQVRAYLSQQPMLAQGAAYRADHAPEVAEAEDFAEAVRSSPDMNEEQKQEWV